MNRENTIPTVKDREPPTGLLLGAGASYDLGMPLVWELTGELKNWLTPEKLRDLNRHWLSAGSGFGFPDSAIEKLASVLEIEDMHYEHILGYLQVENLRDAGLRQAYHGLYLFISDIVYALLQERHLLNVAYIERNIGYLDGIATLVRENAPLWIFSLNHDLMIESFSEYAGIPLQSGFTEEKISLPRRGQNGEILGELEAYVLPEQVLKEGGLPFFKVGERGINLLKVHGSLDVFTYRDGRDMLKLIPSGDGVQGVANSLRIANRDLKYVDRNWPGDVISGVNEIIFEDHSGEMQFLRRSLLAGAFKFDGRHSQVIPNELLGYFRSHINYLTRLVCIGYSFGDQHINQVVRHWLESTRERRLTIVDPSGDRVPDVFSHLAQQVDVISLDCTDYLDRLGGIRRSPLDRQFGTWMRRNGPEARPRFHSFLEQEMDTSVRKIVELIEALPTKDGDIDLDELGLTVEELGKRLVTEVAVPTPELLLEEFLRREESGFAS